MIRIQDGRNGVWLDLCSDAEFSLEMESPIFDEERIPTAFSTDIAFPVTDVNRIAFGYHGIALYPPSVKELPCTIYLSCMPIISGTLRYSGLTDGKLNYSFSGKDPDKELDQKICKIGTLPKAQTEAEKTELVQEIMSDGNSLVAAPLLINANCTDDTCEAGTDQDKVDVDVKYHNDPSKLYFTPAVRLSAPLPHIEGLVEKRPVTGRLYILALCKSEQSAPPSQSTSRYHRPGVSEVPDGFRKDALDVADCLPDVPVRDVVTGLLKMFGGWLFLDGDCYRAVFTEDIFGADLQELPDWTDKISDVWSFSKEDGTGFRISYTGSKEQRPGREGTGADEAGSGRFRDGSSGIGSTYGYRRAANLSSAAMGQSRATRTAYNADTYSAVISGLTTEDFRQRVHTGTGELFSARAVLSPGGSTVMDALCDMIYANANPYSNTEEEDKDMMSCDVHFSLVRSIPDRRHGTMAPVVSPPEIGDRPSESIIGEMLGGSLVSRGFKYAATASSGEDLSPESLYAKYHKPYADWLMEERQTLSVDVNLRPDEVCALRLWRPVIVRHRLFLIKSLSVAASASSGIVSVSASLVSLPCPFQGRE